MINDPRYKGIFFMLFAALGFSMMGGAAKALKESFTAGQLVLYRNAIGLLFLVPNLLARPPIQTGGKPLRLAFRGLMGTIALYTLLYCILHLPLGTAMSYNLTSALFIAIFSFFLFGEYHGKKVLLAVLLGFAGMLLIYKPVMHFPLVLSCNRIAFGNSVCYCLFNTWPSCRLLRSAGDRNVFSCKRRVVANNYSHHSLRNRRSCRRPFYYRLEMAPWKRVVHYVVHGHCCTVRPILCYKSLRIR